MSKYDHLSDNMSLLNKEEIEWAIRKNVINTHCAGNIRHMMDMEDPESTIQDLRARIVELEKQLDDEITNRLWANG
ncbi:hypothetical protein ZPAH1_orf00155 [Aeromonas phage ZPAH1]|nr:hypothetical protein ASwh1_106 [Aeromonas phage Aswh_1]QQG33917.1 hypothetical protein ZPAH1_orf00155 [Aeromonas phage ZPAH1]